MCCLVSTHVHVHCWDTGLVRRILRCVPQRRNLRPALLPPLSLRQYAPYSTTLHRQLGHTGARHFPHYYPPCSLDRRPATQPPPRRRPPVLPLPPPPPPSPSHGHHAPPVLRTAYRAAGPQPRPPPRPRPPTPPPSLRSPLRRTTSPAPPPAAGAAPAAAATAATPTQPWRQPPPPLARVLAAVALAQVVTTSCVTRSGSRWRTS